MKTHCDCGKRLSPCFSSWFCPVCDGDNPPSEPKGQVGPFEFRAAIEKIAKGPNYIKPGHYDVRIDRVSSGKTKLRDFVTIDCTVLKVLHPDSQHKVGDAVCQVLFSDSPSFLPRFKWFLGAALNCPDSAVTREVCEDATGPNNPYDGLKMEVRAKTVTDYKTQLNWTQIDWIRRIA